MMKKLLFVLLASFAFVSCGSGGPESSARSFSENLAKGDFDEAKKYGTVQTGTLLDMVKSMAAEGIPKYEDYKFKMVRDSIIGDTAWVTYLTPLGDEDVLDLIKEDGEWKVSMGK